MLRIRKLIFVIILSFLFLYGIEGLARANILTVIVYGLLVLYVLILMFLPVLRRLSFYWSLLLTMPLLIFIKGYLGFGQAGNHWIVSFIELFAFGLIIGASKILLSEMANYLEEFSNLVVAKINSGREFLTSGQEEIYREIRRARRYQRPIALLSVSAEPRSVLQTQSRFLAEMQELVIQDFITARITKFLIEELRNYDIVVKNENQFLVVLPETKSENVSQVIDRLREDAMRELGIHLKIGVSTFPRDAVTLESMIKQADGVYKKKPVLSDHQEQEKFTNSLNIG